MDALTPSDPNDRSSDGDAARDQAPHDDPSSRRQRSGPYRRERRELPTPDQIKAQIAAIPRLLVLGIIPPAVANAMRAALEALLRAVEPRSSAAASSAQVNAATWLEILLQYPEVAPDLAALLGDEAVDRMLDAQAGEGGDAKDGGPAL